MLGSVLLCGTAHADSDGAKLTDAGARSMGTSKVDARISAQAQLFVEQKDAPVASKTWLGPKSAPRLSAKHKD